MKRKPRVTYVIPSFQVGGTEMQLLRMMQGLQDDFEVSLVCTNAAGGLIGDARRIAYVRVLHFPTAWDFRMGSRLYRLFRGHTPDILHTFLSGFDLWANRAARRATVPVIISSRRELATWQKARHRKMQRMGNRYADCIVANSQAAADHAMRREGAPPERYRVIRNGIEADDFVAPVSKREARNRFRLPHNKRIVGMVANFSPVKDHRLFMDMANLLLKKRDDVHFVLVGSGKLVESLGKLIERRRQGDHFNRICTVGEIAEIYRLFDVFVMTSKVEGFPNAVMEAMASGTPVVAASVGGITEMVFHQDTGLLIESRRPQDFAENVEWVLTHPEEAAAMAARGAAWVREHLSIERMASAYRDLYHELLRRKGALGD